MATVFGAGNLPYLASLAEAQSPLIFAHPGNGQG